MTRDLWLQSLNGKPLLENVLTGEALQAAPEQLLEIQKVLRSPDQAQLNTPLLRAVDRVLRQWSVETDASPSERLEICRQYCFKKAVFEGDIERDLRGVFNTALAFLQEPTDRSFTFNQKFLQSVWRRPTLEFHFGQLPCMPESTQRRIEQATPYLQPESRALILGDDDLMGLCWGQTFDKPCDIFELDQRILDFYADSPVEGLEFHQRDLTKGLAEPYHGRYDIIFTDPMYGKDGMDMFLTCCSQGLSNSNQARLFLSTRPDLIEAGDKLEERLRSVGLRVHAHHRDFSRYKLPERTRRMALDALRPSGLPRYLLRGLLKVPYYYSDLLEVARI
jgi:hypothetical protein